MGIFSGLRQLSGTRGLYLRVSWLTGAKGERGFKESDKGVEKEDEENDWQRTGAPSTTKQ